MCLVQRAVLSTGWRTACSPFTMCLASKDVHYASGLWRVRSQTSTYCGTASTRQQYSIVPPIVSQTMYSAQTGWLSRHMFALFNHGGVVVLELLHLRKREHDTIKNAHNPNDECRQPTQCGWRHHGQQITNNNSSTPYCYFRNLQRRFEPEGPLQNCLQKNNPARKPHIRLASMPQATAAKRNAHHWKCARFTETSQWAVAWLSQTTEHKAGTFPQVCLFVVVATMLFAVDMLRCMQRAPHIHTTHCLRGIWIDI